MHTISISQISAGMETTGNINEKMEVHESYRHEHKYASIDTLGFIQKFIFFYEICYRHTFLEPIYFSNVPY